jgi:plasmid maintenance system antidote protein VapI
VTRYRLSVLAGIPQSTLSKFVHGERGLSLESIDRLVDALGLEIRPKRKKGK